MGTFIYANFICLKSRLHELRDELNLGKKDEKRTLEEVLKLVIRNSLQRIELNESDRHRSMFEDNGFVEFDNCRLHLPRLEQRYVRELITNLCLSKTSNGIYMSLKKEDDELKLLSSLSEKPLHRMNKVTSFAMGTIVNATTFVPHFDSIDVKDNTWKVTNSESIADFEHDINSLSFYFRCDSLRQDLFKSIRYRFKISYDHIKALIFSPNNDTMTMYIVLKCPPMLFQSLEDNINFEMRKKIRNRCDERSDEWIRTSSFAKIDGDIYGKCNVFKLDIPLIKNPDKIIPHIHYECPWSLIRCLPLFRDVPIYFTTLRQSPDSAMSKNIQLFLNPDSVLKESKRYDILYALECIQSHSWHLVDELKVNKKITSFGKKMNQLVYEDVDALEDVIYLLYDAIQTSHFINIFESLQTFYDNVRRSRRRVHNTPKNTIMFKRVALTPTRVLVLPKLPYKQSIFAHDPPEGSNQQSVLYRAEYAIRAEFKDDDLSKLNWSIFRIVNWELEHLQREEEDDGRLKPQRRERMLELLEVDEIGENLVKNYLDKCIKKRLINGLNICGREYHIFGSSPSQMKEFGMLLYAKDCRGDTADDVRLSLGDVYKERNVAKFVTRVGLSVSEVEEFVDVSDVDIVDDFDDIVGGENNKYTFSDGCGMISEKLAMRIFEQLKRKSVMENLEEPPSAYQIRIGGCKGMLVINPELEGLQIKIRKSMRKYKSNNMSLLGILKVSNVRAVHLNRPFTMLLDQLGTKREILKKLLKNHLRHLGEAFVNDKVAKDLLYNHSTLSRYVNMSLLSQSGIRLLDEPFFRLCLESVIAENVRTLKAKTRIKIDRSVGRSMFGVIDETKKLEQGQIFVQYSDVTDSEKKTVLSGRVLVTKFPCLHPGDVQVFEAVDVPELHHIFDCIVFPAKGERPHPDEMAGSDLDGDEYAVIWDKDLYPKKIYNPLDYTGEEVSQVDDKVTNEDILNFFAMYVKEYSIGRLADAHLAWADRLKDGIFDPMCNALAKKHAVSLDFAKTGITMKLDKNEIVKLFPDYMERESTRGFYTSKRALGDIYRNIKFIERGLITDVPLDFGQTINERLRHPNVAKYMSDAKIAYDKYGSFVQELQYRYQIMSEASIIFGNTDCSDEYLISSQQSKVLGYKIRDMVRNMFTKLKDDFEEEFLHRNDGDIDEDRLAKASAYYIFTADCSDRVKYYGLPWLFSEYLANLALKTYKGDNRDYSDDLYSFVAYKINVKYDPEKCGTIDGHVSKARQFFQRWLISYRKQMLHLSNQLLNTEINKALEMETFPIIHGFDEVETTCGDIVVNVLKTFTENVFELDDDLLKHEKAVKRALGVAAMITLQNIYKTRNSDPLTQHKPIIQNLQFQQYYLSFVGNTRLKDFIAKNDEIFRTKMLLMANVHAVHGRWFEKRNQHHYYLSAFGTPVSLQALNLVVAALHTNTEFDLNAFFLVDT